MSRFLRVTVVEVDDGVESEPQTALVAAGDYLLITNEPCYVDGTQVYPAKGTHVITIKGHRPARLPAVRA